MSFFIKTHEDHLFIASFHGVRTTLSEYARRAKMVPKIKLRLNQETISWIILTTGIKKYVWGENIVPRRSFCKN